METYGDKSTQQDNFNSTVPGNDEIRQDSLLEIMLRQRWTILITLGIFLGGAIIYLLNATPLFTSSSSLYVEQTGPKLIGEYEGARTRSKNYLNTQGEVLRSTPILAKVASDEQIQQFKTFEDVDNLLKYLKKNIVIEIGKSDDIITVSFDSPYPEEAARLVNEIVSEYIDYHANQKRSTVSEVLRILQKEKVKRDRELSEKFDELLEFTRINGVTTLETRGNHVALQRLGMLSDALTKAELETINAKADLEAARKMADEPEKLKYMALADSQGAGAAIANSEEREIRLKLRDLQQKLEEARSRCTDEHPLVRELNAKISLLKEQLAVGAEEFAEAYIEVLRQKWITAKQREGELLVAFNEQQKEAKSLGLKATQYSVLQSELERTERLCEILDERIKELNVTEDSGALNINVLEVAQVEDEPSKPQKAKILALALLLGLLAGSGAGMLRDWLDYRLRSAEEVSAVLGVQVLGIVPRMSGKAEQAISSHGRRVLSNVKELASHGRERIAGHATDDEGRGTDSDRGLVTQLAMECGRKMIARLMPIISQACKGIARNFRSGVSSGQADADRPGDEAGSSASQQKNDKPKSRGWLDSQATVADVYQQRLDRALFGGDRKTAQADTSASGGRQQIKTMQQEPEATASGRGQEIRLKPRSIVAEAYRTIRTAVFFGVPKDDAKTILVTSPVPGDGKSTLVSNLAIATAQAGQKTLVLDCDWRKPTQQKIFNCDNKRGISTIFAENIDSQDVIQSGPVEGLDILTRGPEVPNPCELLNSSAFNDLLKQLSQRYDRILIDSAPVTAVADSQILSAISDVTILVLRAEKSTRRVSQHAMHNLSSVGARVLGAVINDVPLGGGHYGYYGGYGFYGRYGRYGYGYGYGNEHRDEHHSTAKEDETSESSARNKVKV